MPGRRMLGAARHHLGAGVSTTIVAVPGLVPHLLDDVLQEVYPRHDTAAAQAPS